MSDAEPKPLNFIEQIITEHAAEGRWGVWSVAEARPGNAEAPGVVAGTPRVHTRFPPEPNGYLHIGHAKSICLNYGLAKKFGGKFNLRFDDTNPAKEEQEYVDSIERDVRWLGADWTGPNGGGKYYASDYFEQMYAWAEELVQKGKAYVCELSAEEVSRRRGTPTTPATSPFRDRPAEESLRLLREMRDGKHPNGAMTLRAKIDLASPNFNLRDPVLYRILHEPHHNTGTKWCLYPMYDWAHGFEDSLEGITHSICTLEFENHRPLYDWFIDAVNEGRTEDGSGPWGRRIHHPQQIEFARLSVSYMMTSKRKLLELVREGHVRGWDDPRMPTIAGIRRRGYTSESIRDFCEQIGVAKYNGVIELAKLESCVRDDLNRRAPRVMAVLRPLKVVIENWPSGHVEWFEAVNNPEDPSAGTRRVPFSGELYIERDDFMEDPPKKFFRLSPGAEVRLRYAFFVRCTGVTKDSRGEITEVRCTYDPATRGGDAPDGRKVKGTIHWVSAAHAIRFEARLYETLFSTPDPESLPAGDLSPEQLASGRAYLANLNPKSLEVVEDAWIEPNWRDAAGQQRWSDGIERVQFERLGYFALDPDSTPTRPVFNRTVTLKDSWAKAKG
jgi:glutaminyl-tRNA synthetase